VLALARVNSTVRLLSDSMKPSSVHRIPCLLAACFLLASGAAAQPKLTQRDKSRIIRFILRTYDFGKSATRDGDTVYLLNENISRADIPPRPGVTFEIVSQSEINRLKATGVEYYRLNEFDIHRTFVRTYFVRQYTSSREANSSAMEYTCRKVRGRWKFSARLGGVGTT
jgi:hypothetical protein